MTPRAAALVRAVGQICNWQLTEAQADHVLRQVDSLDFERAYRQSAIMERDEPHMANRISEALRRAREP